MIKKIIIFVVMLIMSVIFLTSCIADIDGEYDGLSIGLDYRNPKSLPRIVGAVRSDKTEFNVDDVTLDFYYGWNREIPYIVKQNDIIEQEQGKWDYTLGFVLCLCNPDFVYNNIPRHDDKIFYAKEIPVDEFITDEYKVTFTKREGKQFQQRTSLTVPKEMLKTPGGRIWFTIETIWYSHVDGKQQYRDDTTFEWVSIRFEYISENTVKLSKY
jgi:hypothetical protein